MDHNTQHTNHTHEHHRRPGHHGKTSFYKKITQKCLPGQLPRFYSNLFVIWIIGSGAYLDIAYLSYSIENKFDKAYQSMFMLIMFLWAGLIYLKASHTKSSQTKVEDFIKTEVEREIIYQKPIVNINITEFDKECDQCKQKKFHRSSHCRICGFCVLRRDHHCPGLGICVGYQNTQSFINLLFIMTVS